MEKLLTFQKRSRDAVFIDNIFYGKQIGFSVPCEERVLVVAIGKHTAKFSTKLSVMIAGKKCDLLLETLPGIDFFSKNFLGMDLLSIPKEIQMLVLQTAMEKLLGYFSSKLSIGVMVESVEILTTYNPVEGIDFTVKEDEQHVTAGTLVAPKEILALFSKKISNLPKLRSLNYLGMPYKICLGKTFLTKEDYSDLCEEDIVFLDQHELAKQKKVSIVGFGGVGVRGEIQPNGVVVKSIYEESF